MTFLSDDINHNYNFVKHVLDLVIKKLSEKMNIAKLVILRDGCSSQYKSKGPLADITFYELYRFTDTILAQNMVLWPFLKKGLKIGPFQHHNALLV